MTSWRHSWSAVCAVCGRRVLHRMTAWSETHKGRVCGRCSGADNRRHPRTRVAPVTANGIASQPRDTANHSPHNRPINRRTDG